LEVRNSILKLSRHQLDSIRLTNSPVLNSRMRRIDLFCKLVGPFAIGLLDGISVEAAILLNLAMSIFSVAIE
jgi:solute carrier family 40 (iron-regulated transporter), member 1